MPIPGADSYIRQVGVNAATGAVTAIIGSLIIGGFLAWIARRAQFRREDRQIRDKLIEDVTRTLGALNIKLQVYERFVIAPVDGVQRPSVELDRRRDDLDAAWEAAAVAANSLESRLRAYFQGSPVPEAWHGAWDCLVALYFSMIVSDKTTLDVLYAENAGEGHSGLSVKQLADAGVVRSRYRALRDQVTEQVATLKMRH
jgi:hypothetical protein